MKGSTIAVTHSHGVEIRRLNSRLAAPKARVKKPDMAEPLAFDHHAHAGTQADNGFVGTSTDFKGL